MAVDHPDSALHTKNIADELATVAGPLEVVVVSPKRPIFEGSATHLTVDAAGGSMGIWPRHADLVAALRVGPLRIRRADDGDAVFAVWGGFLKIGGRRVTILADRAEALDEIDPELARQELSETIAELQHPKSDEEFEALLNRRRWCQTRLNLAK